MKKLLIPVLLGLAFQSTAVFAANVSSAQASFDWNAMTFSLLDLNPSDGLSPSVTWSGQHGSTSANANSSDGGHSSYINDSYNAPSATSVVSSNAVTFYAIGTSTYDKQSLTVTANADTSSVPTGSSGYASTGASATQYSTFSLSGAGVMVINVPYTITVTGDLYNYWDYSSANLSISSNYSASDSSSSGSARANKSFYSYSTGDKSYSGVFTVAVANASDLITTSGSLNSSLSVYANADSYTYVPGVPEPETYAMMLAGLFLIGSVARRQTLKSV